jgi:sugar lactone lactonase YvrE
MKLFQRFKLIAVLLPISLGEAQGQPGDFNFGAQTAVGTKLENPSGIAVDKNGNIYIAERRANRIRKVDQKGLITTLVGTGNRGYNGDGIRSSTADIAVPETLLIDGTGSLIFCDRSNSRVRKVDLESGMITTIAGTGKAGFSGDGGPATTAEISFPYGLAVDASDNLYIADTDNHCIRKVNAKSGIITTVAGTGAQGFSGDGGPAAKATFYRPHVVTIDPEGSLIIGDSFNQRIRRVDTKTGVIQTIAGTGEQRHAGDGGLAMDASFVFFGALLFDSDGDLYMSGGDHRIRKISATTQQISTIAGTGNPGNNGYGSIAPEFQFNGPYGMTMDENSSLYVVDSGNGRVVKIDKQTQRVKLIAGIK